jgi:hypothetical protein
MCTLNKLSYCRRSVCTRPVVVVFAVVDFDTVADNATNVAIHDVGDPSSILHIEHNLDVYVVDEYTL